MDADGYLTSLFSLVCFSAIIGTAFIVGIAQWLSRVFRGVRGSGR